MPERGTLLPAILACASFLGFVSAFKYVGLKRNFVATEYTWLSEGAPSAGNPGVPHLSSYRPLWQGREHWNVSVIDGTLHNDDAVKLAPKPKEAQGHRKKSLLMRK